MGAGAFGTVFAGVRKSDGLKVAIKCIPIFTVKFTKFMDEFGLTWEVPLEVVMLLRAGGDHTRIGQKHAVSLLEWYELDTHLLIVMERPDPCMTLRDFVYKKGRAMLTEEEAKDIIRQVIKASHEMCVSDVFHRDLKCTNILVQPSDDGNRVRIVDFGCSCAWKPFYRDFAGTFSYAPPEYFKYNMYGATFTDVWQVGALLYELLTGDFFNTRQFMGDPQNKFNQEVSQSMKTLQVRTSICRRTTGQQH